MAGPRIPIYDATAPIVCTIDDHEVADRVAVLERLRSRLLRLERVEHGLLLHFPAAAEVEADLRAFAVDEKRCCQFWGFEVGAADAGLTLRWEAPPAASELLDQLAAALEGDQPISQLSGLL